MFQIFKTCDDQFLIVPCTSLHQDDPCQRNEQMILEPYFYDVYVRACICELEEFKGFWKIILNLCASVSHF